MLLLFNKYHPAAGLWVNSISKKKKKKKCLEDFSGVNGWPFVQDKLMIKGVNSVWQAVMAVFHTFHLSCEGIMGLMSAALRRLPFNLLPLLEAFGLLIYLFILINVSPPAPPCCQFLLEVDRKWWILTRDAVRCCNPLGPGNSSVSTFCAHRPSSISPEP